MILSVLDNPIDCPVNIKKKTFKTMLVVFFFYSPFTDMRKGKCHLSVVNDTCMNPLSPAHRAVCCCTSGKAWGEPCEPCPQKGTGKNETLSYF